VGDRALQRGIRSSPALSRLLPLYHLLLSCLAPLSTISPLSLPRLCLPAAHRTYSCHLSPLPRLPPSLPPHIHLYCLSSCTVAPPCLTTSYCLYHLFCLFSSLPTTSRAHCWRTCLSPANIISLPASALLLEGPLLCLPASLHLSLLPLPASRRLPTASAYYCRACLFARHHLASLHSRQRIPYRRTYQRRFLPYLTYLRAAHCAVPLQHDLSRTRIFTAAARTACLRASFCSPLRTQRLRLALPAADARVDIMGVDAQAKTSHAIALLRALNAACAARHCTPRNNCIA